MKHKTYCLISGIIFALVSLAHLGRIILGTAIQVGTVSVPMSVSWVGLIVAGALAIWGFRSAR